MKKTIFMLLACALITTKIKAQYMDCSTAVYRLQSYAQSVNQQYWYYYNNVGNFCGYNWQWCLGNLNTWYYNQCVYVNQTYYTIANQCTQRRPSQSPAPTNRNRHDRDINENTFEDLAQDIEDVEETAGNQRVRISIPSSPNAWKP